ncbi:MAG TPA: hypothetical protein VL988_06080 [Solirubrobacteraceae bacterium]|nr:hypothetical protein [Solirubrobacteraceae bacterium]
MRGFKLVATLLAVLALGAIAAATASAAPEFLPGAAGTTFTGKSKKAKLQVKEGATIECSGSKASGELLGKTTALFIVTFEGCKSLGLAANSLGDSSGIILVHVEAETCFINLSPLEAGLIIKPLPVHIEVPAAEQLVLVEGDFAAKIEPINTSTTSGTLVIAQKGGVQSIDGCRNAANELVKHTLTTVENENTSPKQSGEEAAEGTLSLSVAQELMA